MSNLTINVFAYFGCALIGFSIGFLELLRVKILNWLPFAGMPFSFSDRTQSHTEINSFVLAVFLIGLFIVSGVWNLFSTSPAGAIHWHWIKIGLIMVSVAAGEYARMRLYEYMTEAGPPAPKTIFTEADFNKSVDAKLRADFLDSAYARQFSSFEAYRESLEP